MQENLFAMWQCSLSLEQDIFSKYLHGVGISHMPFRLIVNQIQAEGKVESKRNGVRGPYRKYSIKQKDEIIERMLKGEGLKKIADETSIPKRNLIRWKHQFLQQKRKLCRNDSLSSQESVQVQCSSHKLTKYSMETKEILSEESLLGYKEI